MALHPAVQLWLLQIVLECNVPGVYHGASSKSGEEDTEDGNSNRVGRNNLHFTPLYHISYFLSLSDSTILLLSCGVPEKDIHYTSLSVQSAQHEKLT